MIIRYPPAKPDTNYVIPDNVEIIGDGAFEYCGNLTSVKLGNKIKYIGKKAFNNCGGLSSIVIPDSIEVIGDSAFWWCNKLTSVRIGSEIKSIGNYAFYYCSSLVEIYFRGNAPLVGNYVFYGCPDELTVYYYVGTSGWGETFGGRPTAALTPAPLTVIPLYDYQTKIFGLRITGEPNVPVTITAKNNIALDTWKTIYTTNLTSGQIEFYDPDSPKQSMQFYRVLGF